MEVARAAVPNRWHGGWIALLITVVATAAAAPFGSPAAAGARLVLLLVAAAAFAVVLIVEARRPFLTRSGVLAGVLVTLGVAVAVPPQGSGDLWSYAAYGRTVAHYGQSPYRVDPDDIGPDAITARVPSAWKETPSVYGPVFVGLAAGVSHVAGSSPLANRLSFQGVAALAVLAVLALLARTGSDAGALAFLGLNPAVALVVVNAGHNDALVGLGVLAGVLLAWRGRELAGAMVLGVAALVKIVAVLPLAALVMWGWRQGDRRPWRAALGGLAVVGGAYAVAGGKVAIEPLLAMSGALSRASIWTLAGGVTPALRSPLVSGPVVGFALVTVLIRGWRGHLALLAGATVLVYLLGAPYILPWYAMWALPVLAPHWRSPVGALAAAVTLGLTVSYVGAPHLRSPVLSAVVHPFYAWVMPITLAAGLAWLVSGRRAGWGSTVTDGPSQVT